MKEFTERLKFATTSLFKTILLILTVVIVATLAIVLLIHIPMYLIEQYFGASYAITYVIFIIGGALSLIALPSILEGIEWLFEPLFHNTKK